MNTAASSRRKTAILISGRGSNMMSLIEAAQNADYPAEISVVVSNRPDAYGLVRAREAGIETAVIDHKSHPDRESFERAMDALLEQSNVEIVCLAGFMRVLTPWFIERWVGRLINIHPSLLPSFRGLHTHERAISEGVKLHGCTVHHVVPELDAGPIIAQAAVPVLAEDTPDALGARVLNVEHVLYPLALKLLAEGRADMSGGIVPVLGAKPDGSLISPAL